MPGIASDAGTSSYKPVGAVINGLQILRYLGNLEAPAGVSQIARDLRINASTCYNILRTLVAEDMVIFDPATKGYSLGFGALDLAKAALVAGGDLRLIQPHLERTARDFSLTATLWRRINRERVMLVARAECDAAMRIHMSIGQRLPMWVGALGRCVAAHSTLSEDELRQRFDTLRWQRPPTFAQYLRQVEEARRLGYAIDDSNFVKGVMTIAAPVLDERGQIIFCVSNAMFAGQHSAEEAKRIAVATRDLAFIVSRTLSGQVP